MTQKRLAVIVTAVDAQKYATESIKWALQNSTPELTDVILLDNGSNPPLEVPSPEVVKNIRFVENVGGNASIFYAASVLEYELGYFSKYDIIAFIHCDLFIREPQWDKRVLQAFDADPKLALLGFVGSDQMDEQGGRGSGTRLNYQGQYYEGFGNASTAAMHGIQDAGQYPAANLDHCSLVFRREALMKLRDTPYCPTHFLDRALCVECYARGWRVAYLGIACDHINGGTAGGIVSQDKLLQAWLTEENIPFRRDAVHQVLDKARPAIELPSDLERPDVVGYRESERRFLHRYREVMKMVPFFVAEDYSLIYWSHNGHAWVPRTEWCDSCTWNNACPKHRTQVSQG